MKKVKEMLGFLGFFWRRKKLTAFLLVVLVGVAIWRGAVGRKDGDVEFTQVKRGVVSEELILSGEIKADEHVQLTFPTAGKISWVGISEGDSVKKGQGLAKLDTTVLNAAFQQARATLRAAEASVDKVHDDVKDNDGDETFAEKDTRTAAEVTKDKAWDAYVAAEYNLQNATLVSPFEGIVTYLANPFSRVNVLPTSTQVEIVNPETIYFEVSADQSEVVDLHEGQKVNIVLDSFSDEEFEGMIDFISYTPDSGEAGTVYNVKVTFIGKEIDLSKVRIGMSGDAKFVLSEIRDVLYALPKYVNSDTQGKYVNLSKKNNKVYVEVGLEGEERVEIISDEIKEGDIIFD